MGVQRIDCDHGQLVRQCPICERDQRITELEDALRARQIDVNSAALSDAHKRIAELERHANERRDMVECTDDMSLRTMHELAQEGCRFFYLRPKS